MLVGVGKRSGCVVLKENVEEEVHVYKAGRGF